MKILDKIKKKQRPFLEDIIKVLDRIYYAKTSFFTDEIKKGMSETRFNLVLNYLKVKKFIHVIEKEGKKNLFLGDEGVDFLVNYKRQLNQEKFNKIIALTGCILALIGIYTFIENLGLINKSNDWITWVFIIIFIPCIGFLSSFIINSVFNLE